MDLEWQDNPRYIGIIAIIPLSSSLSREKGGDDEKKGVERPPQQSDFVKRNIVAIQNIRHSDACQGPPLVPQTR
jgi:hypothetical protein